MRCQVNKNVKNSQGRSMKDKVAVIGMLERNGKVVVRVVEDVQANTLTEEIRKNVIPTVNKKPFYRTENITNLQQWNLNYCVATSIWLP